MQSMWLRNNNNNRGNNNNQWPRRSPPSDQRPPSPLESVNMINEYVPFCRPCESFHEYSTYAFAKKILEESRNQQNNNTSQDESNESRCTDMISSAFAINTFNK